MALAINTALGELNFSVSANKSDVELPSEVAKIYISEFNPLLPEGMSVNGCKVVLITVYSSTPLFNLEFKCQLSNKELLDWGSESGQGLEALAWRSKTQLVMAGTEDEEWLKARLPASIILSDSPVQYSDRVLSIFFEEVPKNTKVDVHFIVAWNPEPEPVDSSCWYAVDRPHQEVLEKCQANSSLDPGASSMRRST
jgi:hypothetical protein